MADWYTIETARVDWPDAVRIPDALLTQLLAVSKEAVLAYAPAVDTPLVDIPDGYRQAQLYQAQNVWNASKASPGGTFDSGEYGLTSYPLDWQVRQLIRPKRGRPVLG